MKDFLNKFKNFGLLESLVIFSAVYVITMLIWTASTRSAVEEKANTVKSNHKQIVDFINSEINQCDQAGEIQKQNGETLVKENGYLKKLLNILMKILKLLILTHQTRKL